LELNARVFVFKPVETPEERRAVHVLRYQVYVLERGFESPEDHPNGLETDAFDAHAQHFLCTGESGEPVGTVRLIHLEDEGVLYPMEQACEIDRPLSDHLRPYVGEVSRLAISKEFRRRADDTEWAVSREGQPPAGCEDRRGLPILFLGLLRQIYQSSVREGLTHLYAVMERQLHVLLRRYGIKFRPVGDEVSYHGLRTPHILPLAEFEAECERRRPDVFAYFREDFPEELTAARRLAEIMSLA
jgi:N-acyl amino acid synthase of PEP-CTERM/exosortase system